MKLNIALTICTAVILSGCEIIGPGVKLEPAKVRIPGVVVGGQQRHCPPGQAKKGNC